MAAARRKAAQQASSKADAVPGTTGREQSAAEWVSPDALHPWPGNPRINARTVDAVAKSIQRFGWGAPIVARRENGEVVAGHTRLLAARKLGEERVPVRYVDLTEQEAHALALADNKIGEATEWDAAGLERLALEDGIDLTALGWCDAELKNLLAPLEPESWTSTEPDRDKAIAARRFVLELFIACDEAGDVEAAISEAIVLAPTRGAALALIAREWLAAR